MTEYAEKKILPYTREQIFDVVADVEKYPQFLPWCTGLRVTKKAGPVVHADMMVAFRNFREQYSSRVRLDAPNSIKVTYIDGPFRYLENKWGFEEHPEGTLIDFHIDFEFKSRALQKLIGAMFDEAVHRMVNAFEERAHALHKSG